MQLYQPKQLQLHEKDRIRWTANDHQRGLFNADQAKVLSIDEQQVLDRVIDALAREARIMLDDGVVTEPQDLDLCMILGSGMPFALGGMTPYLDRTGASVRTTGKRFLASGVASVPE